MESAKGSIFSKIIIGLIGLQLILGVGLGIFYLFGTVGSYFSFDYDLYIEEYSLIEANVMDAIFSISLISTPVEFIIMCYLFYLFLGRRKLFIPIYIMQSIYTILSSFIMQTLSNIIEYEGFYSTFITIGISIFYIVILLTVKEIKTYFNNEKSKRRKYIKIPEEEYELLKEMNKDLN